MTTSHTIIHQINDHFHQKTKQSFGSQTKIDQKAVRLGDYIRQKAGTMKKKEGSTVGSHPQIIIEEEKVHKLSKKKSSINTVIIEIVFMLQEMKQKMINCNDFVAIQQEQLKIQQIYDILKNKKCKQLHNAKINQPGSLFYSFMDEKSNFQILLNGKQIDQKANQKINNLSIPTIEQIKQKQKSRQKKLFIPTKSPKGQTQNVKSLKENVFKIYNNDNNKKIIDLHNKITNNKQTQQPITKQLKFKNIQKIKKTESLDADLINLTPPSVQNINQQKKNTNKTLTIKIAHSNFDLLKPNK